MVARTFAFRPAQFRYADVFELISNEFLMLNLFDDTLNVNAYEDSAKLNQTYFHLHTKLCK